MSPTQLLMLALLGVLAMTAAIDTARAGLFGDKHDKDDDDDDDDADDAKLEAKIGDAARKALRKKTCEDMCGHFDGCTGVIIGTTEKDCQCKCETIPQMHFCQEKSDAFCDSECQVHIHIKGLRAKSKSLEAKPTCRGGKAGLQQACAPCQMREVIRQKLRQKSCDDMCSKKNSKCKGHMTGEDNKECKCKCEDNSNIKMCNKKGKKCKNACHIHVDTKGIINTKYVAEPKCKTGLIGTDKCQPC